MINGFRKCLALILSINRRVSVGMGVLALVMLGEGALGQMQHLL